LVNSRLAALAESLPESDREAFMKDIKNG